MTDKDQCRAAFEDAANNRYGAEFTAKDEQGFYTFGMMQDKWDGWKAAWSHQSAALAAAQEREAKIIQAALVQMDSITKQSFKDAIAALSQPSQAPAQGEPAIPFGDYEGGWKVDPAYLSKVQDWIERQDEYPPGWEVIESVFRAHQALAAAPKEHDHDQ